MLDVIWYMKGVCVMKCSRWLLCVQVMAALGMLLALAACSTGPQIGTLSVKTTLPTLTNTPAATPTLTPPVCAGNFANPPVYYSTLPDATFNATTVFSQVALPPLTRSYDSDAAGGERGRVMCSAGTTESVLSFMRDHLTQLGWQKTDMSADGCLTAGPSYGQQQCWKNGSYALLMGINSNTDWIILFRDPDFM
jgi:hypothetical protein